MTQNTKPMTLEEVLALREASAVFSIRSVGELHDEMSDSEFYGFSAELIGDGGLKALNGIIGNDLPSFPAMLAAPALAHQLASVMEENEKLKTALRQVTLFGGNLSNEVLETATGPNDAASRGIMYCGAREVALQALGASND